jgi:hypothetical protein
MSSRRWVAPRSRLCGAITISLTWRSMQTLYACRTRGLTGRTTRCRGPTGRNDLASRSPVRWHAPSWPCLPHYVGRRWLLHRRAGQWARRHPSGVHWQDYLGGLLRHERLRNLWRDGTVAMPGRCLAPVSTATTAPGWPASLQDDRSLSQAGPVSSIAPDASIIAIQVMSEVRVVTRCINNSCFAPPRRDLVAALEHVRTLRGTHKIAVVNFSSLIGTAAKPNQPYADLYPDVKTAVDNLRSLGIPVAASAGDDGKSAAFLVAPQHVGTFGLGRLRERSKPIRLRTLLPIHGLVDCQPATI